jgi:choline dehydrogenase-like flavoprotein
VISAYGDYTGELRERCDVLVIGSGPAGGVISKVLAEAGRDVLLVEEGPPYKKEDLGQEASTTLRRMVREAGMRAARGAMFMPTMQAIGLGGGTLINSAICMRAPDFVLDKWAQKSGVAALSAQALGPHYDEIERFWNVQPTPMEVQGRRNLLFKQGCDALGISSAPVPRNVKGCKGSAECFTGCRNGAKQSTDISYVPAAIKAGARVLTSVRAEQITVDGRRAKLVRGHVVEPFTWRETHAVEIEAKLVVLAAGCMASPVLLEKSGLGGGYVGRELQFHPGYAIMAMFEEPVHPWQGATQGYHSLEYLKEGLKLEVLWAPPSVLAARLPGMGHAFQSHLLSYDHMAPFDVIVAPEHSVGRVKAKRTGFDPDITYDFDQRDVDKMMRGVGILSDIAWAAGAKEIVPGLHGVPERLRSKAEAEILKTKRIKSTDTISAANHAFGTTRMSVRPEDGVVDEWGRVHTLDNVYVADTGIFPGSPAVNPMLTAMAIANRIATHLAS